MSKSIEITERALNQYIIILFLSLYAQNFDFVQCVQSKFKGQTIKCLPFLLYFLIPIPYLQRASNKTLLCVLKLCASNN